MRGCLTEKIAGKKIAAANSAFRAMARAVIGTLIAPVLVASPGPGLRIHRVGAVTLCDVAGTAPPLAKELRAAAVVLLRGCLTEKKSLVKIGEPSHTRRFASDRGEFSPNGSHSARVV